MARLTDTALKRLDDARARADELTRELSDPATFEDARRAADLGREQAELAGVVERYDRYSRLATRLDEAEAAYQKGLTAVEHLAAAHPEFHLYRNAWASGYNNLGYLLAARPRCRHRFLNTPAACSDQLHLF